MRPSESLKVAGRPIAYYPKLAKPLGGVNAAILFGHFFYWHDKTENPLGVYRTAEEIEEETGLSVQEQRTARSKLRERGVLIETEKRIEHRIYYKLDLNAFDDLMLQHSGSEESTAPKCNINSRYKNRRFNRRFNSKYPLTPKRHRRGKRFERWRVCSR